MSASRSPTLAPESWREAARLTAMVDLPPPPFPEPTAITCFTPGTILSREPRLNAARTLEVIFRSTAVTPGRLPTSSWAWVWKRSRTGQAGVVSSNVKLTRPWSLTSRSLIMPRLTTSRPRSGSLIADRTLRISSLLGTEDHRCSQGEDSDQGEQRDHYGVETDSGNCARTARSHSHVPSCLDQGRGDSDHRERPEREPRQLAGYSAGRAHGDEEDDDQRELERREVSVRLVEPAEA